jgi:hypothetical protein
MGCVTTWALFLTGATHAIGGALPVSAARLLARTLEEMAPRQCCYGS